MTSVKHHRANLIGLCFPFTQRLGDRQQQFRNLRDQGCKRHPTFQSFIKPICELFIALERIFGVKKKLLRSKRSSTELAGGPVSPHICVTPFLNSSIPAKSNHPKRHPICKCVDVSEGSWNVAKFNIHLSIDTHQVLQYNRLFSWMEQKSVVDKIKQL